MTAGNVLMELLQNPTEPLGLSRHSGTILADWLEEAMLSASRQKSGEIHDAIVQLYESALVSCSTDVKLAIQASSKADYKLRESYQMGMLSLAQLLVAQGLDRKINSEFVEFLKDPANIAYIVALFDQPHSNKELAKIVGQTEENVSRKLRRFRELGVTSSKKVGTTVINSLTVTARQIIEDLGLQKNCKPEAPVVSRRSAICAFEIKKDSSKPYMQHQIGFSRPSLHLVERMRA
ncbi:helix-turn-helix domain-containing protein [Pseudomonas fragi]|uniref:helix-turn-helix domain-containing protein n=1 Tax=Pseudomonas fragi TaxID=296 RepID=UPI0030B4EB99